MNEYGIDVERLIIALLKNDHALWDATRQRALAIMREIAKKPLSSDTLAFLCQEQKIV